MCKVVAVRSGGVGASASEGPVDRGAGDGQQLLQVADGVLAGGVEGDEVGLLACRP